MGGTRAESAGSRRGGTRGQSACARATRHSSATRRRRCTRRPTSAACTPAASPSSRPIPSCPRSRGSAPRCGSDSRAGSRACPRRCSLAGSARGPRTEASRRSSRAAWRCPCRRRRRWSCASLASATSARSPPASRGCSGRAACAAGTLLGSWECRRRRSCGEWRRGRRCRRWRATGRRRWWGSRRGGGCPPRADARGPTQPADRPAGRSARAGCGR
mmetsp:Transcript_19677/g.44981  ORF Transcript_19677/g.44981 Transcript_19677/m.44981 type:complete len:217 (+) Transcript_19677:2124-2774(+)